MPYLNRKNILIHLQLKLKLEIHDRIYHAPIFSNFPWYASTDQSLAYKG